MGVFSPLRYAFEGRCCQFLGGSLKHRKPSWRPTQWRAPTWSWASVDCRIEFYKWWRSPTQRYVQVLEACCVSSGTHATGEILSAKFVLLGRHIPASASMILSFAFLHPLLLSFETSLPIFRPSYKHLRRQAAKNANYSIDQWWERITIDPNTRSLHLKLADSNIIAWCTHLDDYRYPNPSIRGPLLGMAL